jgi:hypothetical protein
MKSRFYLDFIHHLKFDELPEKLIQKNDDDKKTDLPAAPSGILR